MPTANFTDIALKWYPAPKKATVTYWDTTTRGLGLRVSSGGARTFIVLIDSGRRQKIGRYPSVSLADARTEAKRILTEKTLGKMRPTHKAFDDALGDFLKERAKHARTRTVVYTRLLKRHYPFARKCAVARRGTNACIIFAAAAPTFALTCAWRANRPE